MTNVEVVDYDEVLRAAKRLRQATLKDLASRFAALFTARGAVRKSA